MTFRRFLAGALLLALPLLSGCDDETLTAPQVENDLFTSYVSIGNSITAGFQSGGINSQTQSESYAVLLAEQMATSFDIPELVTPGCPPPFVSFFNEAGVPAPQRPPGTSAETCGLRTAAPPLTLNNVAVPDAQVLDVLSNQTSSTNALTQFILGGRTQIDAALDANPTFATVWIGNNDVLDGAIAGDTTLVTSVDSFQTRYTQLVSELEAANTLEGAVFLGVADVTFIPHFSRGDTYRQVLSAGRDAGVLPPNFELNSCAPSESGSTLIPFQHGTALVQVATVLRENLGGFAPTITIDCSDDRTVEETVRQSVPDDFEDMVVDQIGEGIRSISLLTLPEISFLEDRVAAFNQVIQNRVDDNYGYVNPNDLFQSNSDRIPAFPELFENPDTPWGTDQPFGPLFSLDGIHPSSAAHQLVADAVIGEIKSTYDAPQLSTVSSP